MGSQNPSKIDQVLDRASELEAGIARLYEACAEHWPEDRAFWKTLASQERGHAEDLASMRHMVDADPSKFELASSVNPVAVEAFITRLDEVTRKVLSGEYDKLRALSVAADMEQSVLERKFPAAIKTANVACARMQGAIVSETRQHHKALLARIETAKGA